MEKYIAVDNIDAYYEQVVKRKMSPANFSRLILSLAFVAAAIFVMIYLMVTVADWLFLLVLSMAGFAGYLVYYLIKNSHVEYEYTFVLGELRIAKIKGNSKRRTITYFDVKAIDDIGHYIDAETGKRTIDPKKYPNLLRAAENEDNLDTYYFIIHDKVRKKPAVLLLTPNEKTMSLIRPYLSVSLKKKFMQMQKEDELIRKAVELTHSKGKTSAELGRIKTDRAEPDEKDAAVTEDEKSEPEKKDPEKDVQSESEQKEPEKKVQPEPEKNKAEKDDKPEGKESARTANSGKKSDGTAKPSNSGKQGSGNNQNRSGNTKNKSGKKNSGKNRKTTK